MLRRNKIALRLLMGGLFGAMVGLGLAQLVMYLDVPTVGFRISPGGAILAFVGALYVLMGLIVWIGVSSPKLGVKILNVVDEDDLRDRRPLLHGSAVTCLALGVAMVTLPFAGDAGIVSRPAALLIVAVALAVSGLISWVAVRDRHYDEFWSHIVAQASAVTLALLASLMVVWGSAAHLGLMSPPDPLLVVAAPPALFLLASIIAVGRKGLLFVE